MISVCVFLLFVIVGIIAACRINDAAPIGAAILTYVLCLTLAGFLGFRTENTYTAYSLYDVEHPYLITDEGMDYTSFLLADPDTGAPRVEKVDRLTSIVYSDEDPYIVRITVTHYIGNWFGKCFVFMHPADETNAILYLPSPICEN